MLRSIACMNFFPRVMIGQQPFCDEGRRRTLSINVFSLPALHVSLSEVQVKQVPVLPVLPVREDA
jgi:hypothetical protein